MSYRNQGSWATATAAAALAVFAAAEVGAQAIEEIVVTARKKEESLQDAPVAVTALTADTLRERNLFNVDDIARFTPGLSFSQAFGRSSDRPVIRGQSNVLANVQFGVESGVAYFVDGIYYPSTIQSLDFNLIERIEVIKGPQSALYGRNTYAGAINFITRDPSQDFSGQAKLRYAEHDEHEAVLTLSGPIIPDVLGAAISLQDYAYGGEYTNTITGEEIGDEETRSITGIVTYNPTDNLRFRARVGYSEDDDGPLALFLQGAAENNCLPGFRSAAFRLGGTLNGTPGGSNQNQYFCGEIAPAPVALNTDTGLNGEFDGTAFDGIEREQWLAGLTAEWDVDDSLTLIYAGGYREEDEKFGTDSDHSDANIFFGPPGVVEALFANTNRDIIRSESHELRLEGDYDRLHWLFGLYYYDQTNKTFDITFQSGEDGLPLGSANSNTATIEDKAVFGLVTYDFTDALSGTLEMRYQEEEKSLTEFAGPGLPPDFSDSTTFDDFTPRLTIDYQSDEDTLLYGSFSQGVKPGGFNGENGVTVGQPTYSTEESDNFEIGLKRTWRGGQLQTNASLYYIDATDVQLTTAIPAQGGQSGGAVTSIATNQGEGEILGLELMVTYLPTEYLMLEGTYAYTDAEFTSGCDQDQWILTSGGADFTGDPATSADFNATFGGTATCDISGSQYPLTSEHQASFDATYRRPVVGWEGWEWFLSGNLTFESSKFVQVHNQAETGDATLLGLRAGAESEHWRFALYGKNLTDEDTIILATRWFDLRYGFIPTVPPGANGSFPRGFFGTLRKGRQLGAEVAYKF